MHNTEPTPGLPWCLASGLPLSYASASPAKSHLNWKKEMSDTIAEKSSSTAAVMAAAPLLPNRRLPNVSAGPLSSTLNSYIVCVKMAMAATQKTPPTSATTPLSPSFSLTRFASPAISAAAHSRIAAVRRFPHRL